MSNDAMRVLLVGPYPPPHGGISVHVATAHLLLSRMGAQCEVLDPRGEGSPPPERRSLRSVLGTLGSIRRRALQGFTLHVHENGHNLKSWILALLCSLSARKSPARILTLHSGLLPAYLSSRGRAGIGRRLLARRALRSYDHVLCVSAAIREAVLSLGIDGERLEVVPAFLPVTWPGAVLPPDVREWLDRHEPVLTTALFFRPEYGFDLLLDGLARLKVLYPLIGCLVIGGGEDQAVARRSVHARGMDDWVLLLGDVRHDLCLTLMSHSNTFVRATLADGDAVSVREAMALDVPVVASDAGHRPPGVTIFPRGDAAALAAAVAATLARRRRAPGGAGPAMTESMESLLRTYREIGQRN